MACGYTPSAYPEIMSCEIRTHPSVIPAAEMSSRGGPGWRSSAVSTCHQPVTSLRSALTSLSASRNTLRSSLARQLDDEVAASDVTQGHDRAHPVVVPWVAC